jgi:glyoxylase-like metal-dependent hydrolase (beta-lactamase superfamily II)
MYRIIGYLFIITFLFQFGCTNTEDFKVIRQVAGPIETNCYLIYGTKSKEASLIDPGWRIDTLTAFIKENNLKLKYIFITHGHIDHFYFLPELKKQFPKASWCMQKDDYQGIFTYPEWALKNYGQVWVDSGRTDTQYGSRDDQIKSVRKLYEVFPDSTIVYPGHGKFTDIGSEKKENSRITANGGAWITK